MTDHRIKSASTTARADLSQLIALDANWVLTLQGARPVNASEDPVSAVIMDDDEITIGVEFDSRKRRLMDFEVTITDPSGMSHTLDEASHIDGQEVTLTGTVAEDERTIKIVVIPAGDLPDPS